MTRVAQCVESLCATAFLTELGWMAVAWRNGRVSRIAFGHHGRRAALEAVGAQAAAGTQQLTAPMRQLVERMQRLADGAAEDFADVELDLEDCTAFQRAVIRQCRAIPRGAVMTYGQLAQRAGHPGAARAVGRVMSSNRLPLIVPCHRVVAADGRLGGFSAPRGLPMKRRLLRMEGSL